MKRIDKIKYTNKFIKFIHLVHLLNFLPKKDLNNKFDINKTVKQYDKLIVLASGPSAKKCNLNTNSLFITTNSSYLILNEKNSFIHIIKDLGYLYKFLMFGLKYRPKAVIIDINTHSNGKGMGATSIKLVNKFLGRIKYNYPVLVTDNENIISINKKNYRNSVTDFLIKNSLSTWNSNSGELIYKYGLWLSVLNSKEMLVYGIDAGEGGNRHFDGRSTANNHVAFRDENKKRMGDFFETCQKKFSHIYNYSNFKNNV